MKILKATLKAHLPLALCVLLCSLAMFGVMTSLGLPRQPVLYGSLLGTAVSLLCLFFLQFALQQAQRLPEEDAGALLRHTGLGRLIILFGVACFGATSPEFYSLSVVLPFIFPRLAAAFLNKAALLYQAVLEKAAKKKNAEASAVQ